MAILFVPSWHLITPHYQIGLLFYLWKRRNYQILLERCTNKFVSSYWALGRAIIEQPNPVFVWQGLIDDVRIYDRALSASEVQALYNLGQ